MLGSEPLKGGPIIMDKFQLSYTGEQVNEAIGAVANKQDTLVSGTNIKSINSNSLLGSGNMSLQPTKVWQAGMDVASTVIQGLNNANYNKGNFLLQIVMVENTSYAQSAGVASTQMIYFPLIYVPYYWNLGTWKPTWLQLTASEVFSGKQWIYTLEFQIKNVDTHIEFVGTGAAVYRSQVGSTTRSTITSDAYIAVYVIQNN